MKLPQPLARLRKGVRRLVGKDDQPLSPILEALHLPPNFTGTAEPRRKARVLVQALEDATTRCLIEQSHLFPFGPAGRLEAIEQLARSLWEDRRWHPQGMARADVDLIGYGFMADVMWATATGHSNVALEAKIHEFFRLQAEGKELPPLRPLRNGREQTRLSSRPRVRVR